MRLALQSVILAAFEPDAGPVPGELTHFIAREPLPETLPFPPGYRPLRLNREHGLLACATGVGAVRAAASVMALGLDPRFDLRGARILITGIAGIDPTRGSLGSVVLPGFVVDGDFCHELDAREIPPTWPDGFVPLGKTTPYEQPLAQRFNGDDGIVFRLNPELVASAFAASRDVALEDTPAVAQRRLLFSPAETAHQPPLVMRGDELASTTFWHGSLLSRRAHAWVDYQSSGRATYTITAMEDVGILQSLTLLATAGRVDLQKVVIARAAANFDRQRDGITASESLAETRVTTEAAFRPALENAWRVGHRLLAS
jgi:purine nucleoside permease